MQYDNQKSFSPQKNKKKKKKNKKYNNNMKTGIS